MGVHYLATLKVATLVLLFDQFEVTVKGIMCNIVVIFNNMKGQL